MFRSPVRKSVLITDLLNRLTYGQCQSAFHSRMLLEIGLFLLTVFLGVYYWITKNFGYFKENGLPEAPGTFPFGSEHMWDLMLRKTNFLEQFDVLVEKFKDVKCFGIYNFGQRDVVVKDLELAKMVLIKDADHFIDRPAINLDGSKVESDKIVNYFLTQLKGEQWKKVTNKRDLF